MNNRKEIVIIGGGVIGVCIAYYLSGGKYDVTLVEKDQICSGSSHGNAGLIACDNPIPFAEPVRPWWLPCGAKETASGLKPMKDIVVSP